MTNDFMHVDPERQRQFIESLNSRCHNIENTIGILESNMRMLGADWRDAEFEVFQRQCNATMTVLHAFIQDGRRVSVQLEQVAESAEAYQRIRQP